MNELCTYRKRTVKYYRLIYADAFNWNVDVDIHSAESFVVIP